MASKEARLILRLIDGVSNPAKAIVGSLGRVNLATKNLAGMALGPSRALNAMGRSMRHHAYDAAAMSAAVTVGLTEAAKAVYDYEKEGNRMQAFGLLNDDQRQHLEDEAKRLNKFFPQTNKGILEAASELFRAGLTYEQALGALEGSLQLSLAGDIETQAAADIATNIMYAMKMPMETMDQVSASLQKVNDLLAYGATKSNTDIRLMSDTFRYVAPLAATAGMEIEQVTALTMELAKAGIKGAEAGVALRSGLVRMAKPTKPMIAAFNRLGISMKDFVQYKQAIDASTITSSLLADGYDLSHLTKQIQTLLDDKTLAAAPQRLLANLANMVVGEIGDETVRDKITETLQDAILAGGQKVDLVKLLRTLKDKGATITDISQIFDVRMGSRLAAILYNDLDAVTDDVKRNYRGTAAEMASLMTRGIVGAWLELTAAVENFSIALSDAGVINTVASGMERLTKAVTEASASNPAFLRFATYAAIALAAMAPLGLAASGVASSLALMANPLTWVVGGLTYLGAVNFDAIVSWLKAFGRIFKDNLSPKVLNAFGTATRKLTGWLKQLVGAGADGEAWGRTSKRWAEASADAFNKLYDIGEKIVTSRFFTGFQQGFGAAMENMAAAAQRLASAMGPLGTSMQPLIDFLNSKAGENIGKILGELSGYGLGLAVAAAGIGLAATAVGALGRALMVLSGAKAGLSVLGGLAGLAGIGGGMRGSAKVPGGGKKPGGKMGGLAGILGSAGALGYFMYLLKDWEGGVWHIDPPKPRSNPVVDYINKVHGQRGVKEDPVASLPHPGQERGSQQPVLHPSVMNDNLRTVTEEDVAAAEKALNSFNPKVAKPIVDASAIDAYIAKVEQANEAAPKPFDVRQVWADLWKPIRPVIDDRAVEDFQQRADQAGKQATDALSIVAKPVVDSSAIDAFIDSTTVQPKPFSLTEIWADLWKPLKPAIDTAEATQTADQFAQKAGETGRAAEEALSITARPIVDTSSIDAALAKVVAFAQKLAGLGGASLSASVAATGDAPEAVSKGIGHRASGGPVQRGLTYEINERGRETVTMGVNGYVTPAHRLGDDERGDRQPADVAGQSGRDRDINVTIGPVHIHGGDANEVLSKLGRTIRNALNRSADVAIDGRTSF